MNEYTIKYISNIDELTNFLGMEMSDFELIIKFNTYNLYQEELKKIEKILNQDKELLELLKELQERILEIQNIFYGRTLKEEREEYLKITNIFSTLLTNNSQKDDRVNTMIDLIFHLMF